MIHLQDVASSYLYLFADCFPVKGHSRTLIMDISRSKAYAVDNSYFVLLQEVKTRPIGAVAEDLASEEDLAQYEQFINYLLDNELAAIVDDPALFPPMDMEWDIPAHVSNTIIDVRDEWHDFPKIFGELDELLCRFIQVRCYKVLSPEQVLSILDATKGKHFRSVELLLKYDDAYTSEKQMKIVLKKYPATTITVHSAPYNKKVAHALGFEERDDAIGLGFLLYISQQISGCQACGIINQKTLYVPSLRTFLEISQHNGCLNRKIAVDENGNIKNCPSMTRSFGNIREVGLKDALYQEGFKDPWNITKDKILVCRDCEFRLMCTDCRAYLSDPADALSKPAKCSYDPYAGKWM